MATFAEIKDGVVTNKAKFKDGADLPDGWIDVTDVACNAGDPVVDDIPIQRPSEWHTLDGLKWVVTAESQAKKDIKETEKVKASALSNLNQIDTKSIRSMREFLVEKFGEDPMMPDFLKIHEVNAKAEREKIK